VDFKRPSRWKRILRRTAMISVGLLGAAMLFGFVVQRRRDAAFRASHPAPGTMVDVGGRKTHCRALGSGDFTFILEPGLGDYSGAMATLEAPLAKLGRVFVYDRAGLGWSESSSQPRTVPQLASELHQVLEAAHVRKPYILVGHSLGGAVHTYYAMDHPGDVAGLLLIDPSHKDQFTKLPAPPAGMTLLMTQISRTAPLGLPQLLMQSRDPVKNQTRHILTSGAEMRAALKLVATWGDRPLSLGHTPIYVLTAGDQSHAPGKTREERKAAWEAWNTLHDDLVAASTSEIRKHDIVAGASHYLHQTHAAEVVRAARELVNRIKTAAP
jgi:pimeloyl-ACP methyl ester carboxylesterase